MLRRAGVLAIAAVVSLCLPGTALAQAWLPAKGEGNVSLTGQHVKLSGHFDSDGSRLPECAPSKAIVTLTEFEYGLTNKLAFGARLPYIASRFTGHSEPCIDELHELYEKLREQTPELLKSLDTGAYYATFQDFDFRVRYNLFDRGITITPVIGATIPSHHYRTVGEAAPGQDRLALHTGVNVGRLLDPWVPGAYVHGRYTYSFVQRLYGVPLNRSSAEFEAGYSIAPTVAVRALVAWQHTHGGLTYLEAVDRGFNGEPLVFLDHDRLLRSSYWHVGGGATFTLNDAFDLDAAVLTFPRGADSHYGVGTTIGLTWKFVRTVK